MRWSRIGIGFPTRPQEDRALKQVPLCGKGAPLRRLIEQPLGLFSDHLRDIAGLEPAAQVGFCQREGPDPLIELAQTKLDVGSVGLHQQDALEGRDRGVEVTDRDRGFGKLKVRVDVARIREDRAQGRIVAGLCCSICVRREVGLGQDQPRPVQFRRYRLAAALCMRRGYMGTQGKTAQTKNQRGYETRTPPKLTPKKHTRSSGL